MTSIRFDNGMMENSAEPWVKNIIDYCKEYKHAVALINCAFHPNLMEMESELKSYLEINKINAKVRESVLSLSAIYQGKTKSTLPIQKVMLHKFCLEIMQEKFSNIDDEKHFFMLLSVFLYQKLSMSISPFIHLDEIIFRMLLANKPSSETEDEKNLRMGFYLHVLKNTFSLMQISANSESRLRIEKLQKKFNSPYIAIFLSKMNRCAIEEKDENISFNAVVKNTYEQPMFKLGSFKKVYVGNVPEGVVVVSDSVGEIYDTTELKPGNHLKIYNDERLFSSHAKRIIVASIGSTFIGNKFLKSILKEFMSILNSHSGNIDISLAKKMYLDFLNHNFNNSSQNIFLGHQVVFIQPQETDIIYSLVFANKKRNKYILVEGQEVILKRGCLISIHDDRVKLVTGVISKEQLLGSLEESYINDYLPIKDAPFNSIFMPHMGMIDEISSNVSHPFEYLSDYLAAVQGGYIDITQDYNSDFKLSMINQLSSKDFNSKLSANNANPISFHNFTGWCLNNIPKYNNLYNLLFDYINELVKSDVLFKHKLKEVVSSGVQILFLDSSKKKLDTRINSYFEEKSYRIFLDIHFMDTCKFSFSNIVSSLRLSIEKAYKYIVHKLRSKSLENPTKEPSNHCLPYFPPTELEMETWKNIIANALKKAKQILSILEKKEKNASISASELQLFNKYKSSVVTYNKMRIVQGPPQNESPDHDFYQEVNNNKEALSYVNICPNIGVNITFTVNYIYISDELTLFTGYLTNESERLKAALYDLCYLFHTPCTLSNCTDRYAKLVGYFPAAFIALISPELLAYDCCDAEAAFQKSISCYYPYLPGSENSKGDNEAKESSFALRLFYKNQESNIKVTQTNLDTAAQSTSDPGDSKREVKDTVPTTVNKDQTNPTTSQQVFAQKKEIRDIVSKLEETVKDEKNDKFFEFFKLLKNKEINFNKALRTACTSNDPKVFKLIKILLESHKILNIDINQAAGEKRRSAIHYAAIAKNDDVYALLINYGANHQALDANNHSAEDYFQQKSLSQHARRGM